MFMVSESEFPQHQTQISANKMRSFSSDGRMIVFINTPSLTREVIANVKLCEFERDS